MALVLRRKLGEVINIGSNIEIQVIECNETSCKLEFTAPSFINILRKEVAERDKNNGEKSTTT